MLKYAGDPEILQKDNRPCVLIVRLKYNGKNQDFAVLYKYSEIKNFINGKNEQEVLVGKKAFQALSDLASRIR